MTFWIWILLMVLVVVGLSVAAGAMLSRRTPRTKPRSDKMMALKASGAFPHRKSNRP